MGEYIYDEERALNTTGTIAKFQGKEAFMIEGSHVYTRHAREYIKNNTTGYYMYDLRHSDGDWSRPYWLQRYGSILVKVGVKEELPNRFLKRLLLPQLSKHDDCCLRRKIHFVFLWISLLVGKAK